MFIEQIWIEVFVFAYNRFHHLVHEFAFDAELSSISHGSSYDAAKDIPSPFIRERGTIAEREGEATRMIGDHTESHEIVAFIFLAGQSSDFLDERRE